MQPKLAREFGQGTGLGTTGGRGMNGQNSRSGGKHQGLRWPDATIQKNSKRGFTNRFARNGAEVNAAGSK